MFEIHFFSCCIISLSSEEVGVWSNYGGKFGDEERRREEVG